MTLTHRISVAILALLAAAGITFGVAWIGYRTARADAPYVVDASERVLVAQADAPADAGSAPAPETAPPAAPTEGSAATAPAPAPSSEAKPADKLHDPIAAPQAAFDDLKAAKKLGWGLFVLALLILACRVLSRFGGVFKPLGTGRVAVVIAAVGTLAATAYNALALGGTWMAALAAVIVAGAAYWNSQAQPKPPA